MPFSGPSSYLSTIDEFIGHWTDVNAALAPVALILEGGYSLASLQTDRTAMVTAINELVVAINALEGHRTDRDNRKEPIRERMRQLAAFIRGNFPSSFYVGEIPNLIQPGASPGNWLIAMRDCRDLWSRINTTPPAGFPGPLLLAGGYTQANFVTDTTALETTFQNWTLAEQDVTREVDERETLYHRIRDRLVQYRLAVPGFFPSTHALVLSLPRLTPLPGHTPDPVVLSGVWNPATVKADLGWSASADPDLASYSVRRSGANPYDSTTELVVGSTAPGVTTLSTDDGLLVPGASMKFKVYVVLTTGNEKGSNAVEIDRP